MSAVETLKQAADWMRDDEDPRWIPVADWLDTYAALLEELAHPIAFTGHALAVARTYTEETA